MFRTDRVKQQIESVGGDTLLELLPEYLEMTMNVSSSQNCIDALCRRLVQIKEVIRKQPPAKLQEAKNSMATCIEDVVAYERKRHTLALARSYVSIVLAAMLGGKMAGVLIPQSMSSVFVFLFWVFVVVGALLHWVVESNSKLIESLKGVSAQANAILEHLTSVAAAAERRAEEQAAAKSREYVEESDRSASKEQSFTGVRIDGVARMAVLKEEEVAEPVAPPTATGGKK